MLVSQDEAHAQVFVRDVQVLNQLRVRPAYLGVGIADLDADRMSRLKMTEERGVEVTNTQEGSPADAAGIKTGDVLLSYNGENILGAQQFVRLVRETPAGRKVRIGFWRNGKEQTAIVTTAAPQTFAKFEDLKGLRQVDPITTFQGPDSFSFVMPAVPLVPDVPSIIMAWNSSLLGVECEPVDSQLAQYFGVKQGVLVRSVNRGSVAEKAGMRAGDVLVSVGDRSIKTPDDFRHALRSGSKQYPVSLLREHKQLTSSVVMNQEPQE